MDDLKLSARLCGCEISKIRIIENQCLCACVTSLFLSSFVFTKKEP